MIFVLTCNTHVQSTMKLFKSKEAERGLDVKDNEPTSKPRFKNFSVFVQSQGIGRRQLVQGTLLLYDVSDICIKTLTMYKNCYNYHF